MNGLPLKPLYCTNDLADFQCTRSAIFRDIVSKYTPNDREWIREHDSEGFKSISFTVLPPAPQKVEKLDFFESNDWLITAFTVLKYQVINNLTSYVLTSSTLGLIFIAYLKLYWCWMKKQSWLKKMSRNHGLWISK